MILITGLFLIVNLFWAFYSDNTWDDDCPGRFQNTLHALQDPSQFVNLWNRPLFVLIFALPVQLGAWTIPVIQSLISIFAGFALYQVCKQFKFRFSYLVFPLLAFQPFVFGVSKYAMTEPLAIALISLSLFFQIKKNWNAFAICGALLPLARMELAVFFPFYIIALLNAKKYLSILILGIPGLLWAIAGGVIHGNLFWIIDETIGKEGKENRYGHQNWDTYLSRYAFVIGPILLFFSFLGMVKIWKTKFLRSYVLLPYVLGFFIYTLFSWKLNMGNAAGFLRNIIPISPYLAIIGLAGVNSWFAFATRKKMKLTLNKKPKIEAHLKRKTKKFNKNLSNGKFYGFILLSLSVFLTAIFYTKKLELHHKLTKEDDYTILAVSAGLLTFCLIMLFLKKNLLKTLTPLVVFLALTGYTLTIEHPMANASDERELISDFASFYNNSYLKDNMTYVNHPWFIWSAGKDRFDEDLNVMKKDSLKNAAIGSIALFESHYSSRLSGDVNQTFLAADKNWVELDRLISPKRNFVMSVYQKVSGPDDYVKTNTKYIEATDSSKPSAFYSLGNMYLMKKRDYEQAYNAFGKSVNLDSNYTEGFLGLGMVMVRKNNFKSAIEFYNQGLKINPNHFNLLLQKGVAQINDRQFNAAIKTFRKSAEANLKDHNSWYYIGLAYQNQNKAQKSINAFEQCLKRNPKFAAAWQQVAIIQFQMKNKKAACINIKKAAQFGSVQAKSMINKICK